MDAELVLYGIRELALAILGLLLDIEVENSADRDLVSLPPVSSKYGELYGPDQYQYYPSATKSTVCEDDYFLSLSKDRKTFKPIRVCEL